MNGTPPSSTQPLDPGATTQPYATGSRQSWFGPGQTGATASEDGWTDLNWGAPPADAAPLAPPAPPPAVARTYRAFLTARLVLALALLAVVLGARFSNLGNPHWFVWVASAYAVATAALRFARINWIEQSLQQDRLRTRHLLPSVGLDFIVFAFMHGLTSPAINTQALLVLPVLMMAVLAPRILALAGAALGTLILLATVVLISPDSQVTAALFTQAGLTGLGLFLMAMLANEMALRLTKEERSARGSLELARQQAELNGLMIEEMSEGVMVVDRRGRVRAANPAARRLISVQGLGPTAPFKLRGVPAWSNLVHAVEIALNKPELAELGQDVRLMFDDRQERDLRLRARFTRSRQQRSEDLCVLLLEDLRTVRARQRQDKLAAMGRMSAGIAHEIRNPLSAIAQASSLLEEDLQHPTQQHLSRLIQDNVRRLNGIIDDILVVAPGVRPPAPPIDPVAMTHAIVGAWRDANALPDGPDSPVLVDDSHSQPPDSPTPIGIRFEPEHLQRVVVNLLDNALRHQSGRPGAILVTLRWMPALDPQGLLMLSVSSDGEPITAETERALFEPFFSTRSRGTGLGLYICRELCERHGAAIDYRLHPAPVRHRNEFYLTVPV